MQSSPSRSTYDDLLKTIDNLSYIEEANNRDKKLLSSFIVYLRDNILKIVQFERVSKDLEKFLTDYDFSKGIAFDSKIVALQKLHPLKSKLDGMGYAANELSGFPDRYGSQKAIDTCRNLAKNCFAKMVLEEADRVGVLCESNTGKLNELKKLLERDETILSQIKAIVNQDIALLAKFKAFQDELNRYIDDFPHPGQDDLKIVEFRIQQLKELYPLVINAKNAIVVIKDYCNRYNKDSLVARYRSTIANMGSSMKYAEVKAYQESLIDIEKAAVAIAEKFKKEPYELRLMRNIIESNHSLWKEDSERLLTTIDSLLRRNTAKVNFSYSQLETQYTSSKEQKIHAIETRKNIYKWLENNKKYRDIHNDLTNRYLSFNSYNSNIERLCRFRRWRHILPFIPIIGWILLRNVKDFRIEES